MPADIVVRDFGNSNSIIVSFLYPKEPKANGNDTLRISANGRTLNGEPVKSKQWIHKDSLEIITEIDGRDGNDNKPAIIRHTYLLSAKTFLQRKEVMFAGDTKWILRNEYKFMRKEDCE
jgi:pSer/pThr/pTyr-binding forkhead associated (FHA) protein